MRGSRIAEGVWRRRWVLAGLVAAFAVVGSWVLASPHGSSPDDNFHAVSIWCANGEITDRCEADSTGQLITPKIFESIDCYRMDPTVVPTCQTEHAAWDDDELSFTRLGNVDGLRPALYYRAAHTLIGDDVNWSLTRMRIANGTLAIVFGAGLLLLASPDQRRAASMSWLIGSVPLGLFLLTSTNTSAWGIIGAATFWLAAHMAITAVETWRRWGAGIFAVISAIVMLGARTEAVVYLLVSLIGVGIINYRTLERHLRTLFARVGIKVYALTLVGVALAVTVVAVALPSHAMSQWDRAAATLASMLAGGEVLQRWNIALYNLMQMPAFWLGPWGFRLGPRGSLGWLDTSMPIVVPLTLLIATVVLVARFRLLRSRPHAVAVAAVGLAMVVWPVLHGTTYWTAIPGEGLMQPRHHLGLFYVLLGFLFMGAHDRVSTLRTIAARRWFVVVIASAHALALHANIRRYVSGQAFHWTVSLDQGHRGGIAGDVYTTLALQDLDYQIWNLNDGVQWWWNSAPSPMATWVVGSLGFAILAGLVAQWWFVGSSAGESALRGPSTVLRGDEIDQGHDRTDLDHHSRGS